MNKTYFQYLLRSKRHLSIFLILIGLLPTFVFILEYGSYDQNRSLALALSMVVFISFIEALILPFIYFNFLQSKRALDTYYNLPIDRSKLVITNFIHMYLSVIVSLLIGVTIPVLMTIFSAVSPFFILPFFIFMAIGIAMIMLYVLAIIYKTYSIIDSILITIAYLLIPVIFTLALSIFEDTQVFMSVNTFEFVFKYANMPTAYFVPLFSMIDIITFSSTFVDIGYGLMIETILIALVAMISIRNDIKKRKAEVSETVSNNFFAYPLALGLGTMGMFLIVGLSGLDLYMMMILYIFIFIAYLIITFIYRRRITFKKKDISLFAGGIILSVFILMVASNTDAFGLSTRYRSVKEIRNMRIQMQIDRMDVDDSANYTVTIDDYGTSDQDIIDEFIAYEDVLYDRFKRNGYDYDADYNLYVWTHMYYQDEHNNNYSHYDSTVGDVSDKTTLENALSLIEIFKDDATVSKYTYDEATGEEELVAISVQELVNELR